MYFTVMVLPVSQRLCTAAMMLAGLILVLLAARRVARRYRTARKRMLRRSLAAARDMRDAKPLSSYSSLDLLPASSSGSSTGASPSTASSAASTSGSTAETPLSSSTEQVAALS